MELQLVREQLFNAHAASKSQARAELEENMTEGMDESLRGQMLNQHEVKMRKMEAEAAMSRGKTEDELRHKLAERKIKKRAFLEAQHAKEFEAIQEAGPTERAGAEANLDALRGDSGVVIRQEEEAAKVACDLLAEAAAEIRMLKEELKEKAASALQSEAQRSFSPSLCLSQIWRSSCYILSVLHASHHCSEFVRAL